MPSYVVEGKAPSAKEKVFYQKDFGGANAFWKYHLRKEKLDGGG